MTEERLGRLVRLRRAATRERALAVAREERRLGAERRAWTAAGAAQARLRAAMAEVADGGPVDGATLADRHRRAESGVRAAVRQLRRVMEAERLVEEARRAVRAARVEEARLEALLAQAVQRRRESEARSEAREHDELAVARRRHRPVPWPAPAEAERGGEGR
ncbi:MAG: hypothetical protein K6V73_00320 [Firmicutes bacterium]|nr:hypothetical protein [Bacillota bacterium]